MHALDQDDVGIDQQPRAQTRPETPMRDRTRMVTPRSAPEPHLAPSPHTPPRSLLSPTCSPWTLQPPRQRHLAAGTLYVTPPSTTCAGTRDRDRTRSSSFLPLFHRLQAPRRRRDVAEPGASSPVPRNHRNAIVIDDRLRTPRPRPPAIKGGRPCLNTPHHLAPLPLLALLAPFPLYISHHAAPISHRSSPETRKTKPSNSSTSGAAATLPRLADVASVVCPPRRPR
jgi:hypothetical protein